MPSEVLRCTDCNQPLRAVPTWLASAGVKFTCNSCPKRSARPAAARFDTPIEARPSPIGGDPDLDIEDTADIDEDMDADVAIEDMEDTKDDKDLE